MTASDATHRHSLAMAPSFTFPMIGILLPETPHEPGETATREFPNRRYLDVVWEADVERRRGMLLVDAEGRSWRVAAVRKIRRRFRLSVRSWQVEYDFVEEPPMGFEALRGLLLKTLKDRKSAYAVIGQHYIYTDRREILQARSLHDLVRTSAEREEAAAPPPTSWGAAWFGEGRSRRRGYALVLVGLGAVTFLATELMIRAKLPPILLVMTLIAAAMVFLMATSRRLHDLGLSGFWSAAGFFGSGLPTMVLDVVLADAHDDWLGLLWLALGSAALLLVILWPGQRRANRFGPPPSGRVLDAGRTAADDPTS